MAYYKQDIKAPIDEAPCFKRVMINTVSFAASTRLLPRTFGTAIRV